MNRRGIQSEAEALRFFPREGLRLEECNYTCRMGDIDLVMRDGATLVFVEVRVRAFGAAAESITPRKRARLLAAGSHYLAGRRAMPERRFDAVLINNGEAP